jgi:hypothetical protein
MLVYDVMLEGREHEKGFLITFEVAGLSRVEAESLALSEARKRKLVIIRVEETSRKTGTTAEGEPRVLKVYGKGYFDVDGE